MLDVALFGAGLDEAVEGFVVLGTAVGIAGAVLGNGSDEDSRAPRTSAQLTATERKWALRKGT